MGSIHSLFRRRRCGPSKASSATASSPASPTAGASNELERIFNKFDSNEDGKITSSKLAAIFESLDHPTSDKELERMMSEANADGDGFISFDEFVNLNVRTVDDSTALEDLRNAFSIFDLDRNSAIFIDDRSIGEGASVAQCKCMIDGIDRDSDGLISFEEFNLMMNNGSGFPLPARSND